MLKEADALTPFGKSIESESLHEGLAPSPAYRRRRRLVLISGEIHEGSDSAITVQAEGVRVVLQWKEEDSTTSGGARRELPASWVLYPWHVVRAVHEEEVFVWGGPEEDA